MDPAERRYLEDEDTPVTKTMKGATTGFVAGTIYGTIVATWYDVPRVEKNIALPGLLRTLRMMGSYGMTFAAIGGVYIGVEQLLQNYRMKRDFVNGAVGGLVAGASVVGYRDRGVGAQLQSIYWMAKQIALSFQNGVKRPLMFHVKVNMAFVRLIFVPLIHLEFYCFV